MKKEIADDVIDIGKEVERSVDSPPVTILVCIIKKKKKNRKVRQSCLKIMKLCR